MARWTRARRDWTGLLAEPTPSAGGKSLIIRSTWWPSVTGRVVRSNTRAKQMSWASISFLANQIVKPPTVSSVTLGFFSNNLHIWYLNISFLFNDDIFPEKKNKKVDLFVDLYSVPNISIWDSSDGYVFWNIVLEGWKDVLCAVTCFYDQVGNVAPRWRWLRSTGRETFTSHTRFSPFFSLWFSAWLQVGVSLSLRRVTSSFFLRCDTVTPLVIVIQI